MAQVVKAIKGHKYSYEVASKKEETNMGISREHREKNRSREAEGKIVLCNNETCKCTKDRQEENHESHP